MVEGIMEPAKHFRALFGSTVAFAAAFLPSPHANANDGPVVVQGGSIKPAASDAVELVEENVAIEAGEYPDLLPWFSSRVSVHYVLRNRKNKSVKVATGFPMTNCIVAGDKYAEDAMQFKVLDGGKEVKIKAITEGSEKEAVCWALFDLAFAPLEEKDLTMSYREPWLRAYDGAESQDYDFEELVYVLTPAKTWAGKIGSATITLTYPAARRDPGDESKMRKVEPCNFSSTIEPAEVKTGKDEIHVRWSFEKFEPSQELFVTYAPGACGEGPIRIVSPVVNYLRNAELRCENKEQLETIGFALTDALDLPVKKLKKKTYTDVSGKKKSSSLKALIERCFVPDNPFKSLGQNFYGDIKTPEVRKKIKLVLDAIAGQVH
jgi:hypothetical protein